MAEQADRVYKRKKLVDPSDASRFVEIPVIYKANFITAADQYQEHNVYFDNSIQSSRKTHTHRVQNDSQPDQFIDIERIDSFFVTIMAEQAQEYQWVLVNKDPPPKQPDGSNNPAHEKVHYVRYYQSNDNSSQCWIDVELIDELKIVLAADQYQEIDLFARHPDIGDPAPDDGDPFAPTIGFCDPSFDEAPLDDGLDPPYRLDPLQNVVNVHWQEPVTAGPHDQWWLLNGGLNWVVASGFPDGIDPEPWGPPAWVADIWKPGLEDWGLLQAYGPNDPIHAPAAFAEFDPLRTEFGTWTGGGHGPPSPPRGSWYVEVMKPPGA